MTLDQFRRTVAETRPPAGISAPLAALGWAAKGNWDKAHGIVMDDGSREAAWVHAHLHRIEGDLSNARYWYSQAGRTPATASVEREWEEISAALL
jgi:hypothetical protein